MINASTTPAKTGATTKKKRAAKQPHNHVSMEMKAHLECRSTLQTWLDSLLGEPAEKKEAGK